jgi:hypothetical protein
MNVCNFFPLALEHPWALASLFSFMIILQTVGLLGRVISLSQGLYLKHRTTQAQNKHILTPKIHVLCGILTHDPGFRASEDSSCLRPLGYYDRLCVNLSLVFVPHRCTWKEVVVAWIKVQPWNWPELRFQLLPMADTINNTFIFVAQWN